MCESVEAQVGPEHFIFLNQYTPLDQMSDHYEWAVSDLSDSFDRACTPWLGAVFHAPVYKHVRAPSIFHEFSIRASPDAK